MISVGKWILMVTCGDSLVGTALDCDHESHRSNSFRSYILATKHLRFGRANFFFIRATKKQSEHGFFAMELAPEQSSNGHTLADKLATLFYRALDKYHDVVHSRDMWHGRVVNICVGEVACLAIPPWQLFFCSALPRRYK
jgi:hypothetical protein